MVWIAFTVWCNHHYHPLRKLCQHPTELWPLSHDCSVLPLSSQPLVNLSSWWSQNCLVQKNSSLVPQKPKHRITSCSVVSDFLRPHGLQHARLPCPSSSPRACSNSCHWVSDASQPSCPLSSPSPPALFFSASGSFLITRWSHNSAPRFLPKLVESRYLNRYLYTRVHCSIIYHCWKVGGSFSFFILTNA